MITLRNKKGELRCFDDFLCEGTDAKAIITGGDITSNKRFIGDFFDGCCELVVYNEFGAYLINVNSTSNLFVGPAYDSTNKLFMKVITPEEFDSYFFVKPVIQFN